MVPGLLQDKKTDGDKKGEKAKEFPKKVWKPKARSAGRHDEPDEIVEDVVVHKFGSEKHLDPEGAASAASRRASVLQSELGLCPMERSVIKEGVRSTVSPSPKKSSVVVNDDCGRESKNEWITTHNPCTGRIPIPTEEKSSATQGVWNKDALPLDFSWFNFSDLGEPTRKLCITDESWLFRDEIDPILGPTASTLSAPQEELEQWRSSNKPLLSDRLVPFVRNLMLSENNSCLFFC